MQQLAFSLHEPIHVEPDPTVLFSGANARRRTMGPLFAHQHVPVRPASVRDDQTWLRMLDLAEDARRYNQARTRCSTSAAAIALGPAGRSAPGT